MFGAVAGWLVGVGMSPSYHTGNHLRVKTGMEWMDEYGIHLAALDLDVCIHIATAVQTEEQSIETNGMAP